VTVSRGQLLAGGERPGALHRHVDQDRLGHHLVHQAELPGLRRADGLAGQNEIERRLGADEPRQPLRATRAGEEPELHLGEPELGTGSVRRDAPAAGQRPLQSTPEAGAMDGRDDGLGKEGQSIESVLPLA
jgi:hypothetical protein